MKTSFLSKLLAPAPIFFGLVFAPGLFAAPGDLDTSFAGTGEAQTGFGFGDDYCHAAAAQSDGRLVMGGNSGVNGGDVELVRFDTNNMLDPTFGNGGKVVTTGLSNAVINALNIQTDGKIVATGGVFEGGLTKFAVFRYNADGTPDSTFGNAGMQTTSFGQSATGNGMAVQADGKIIIVGVCNGEFAVARYNTNGVLDTSFGGNGTVVSTANSDASANAVLLESSGDILVAGTGGFDFALLCYTTNGVLDTTFGGGTGAVYTPIGSSGALASANAIAFQAGQLHQPTKIVLAGNTQASVGHYVLAVARYSLNGTLDASFGSSGTVTQAIAPSAPGTYGDLGSALLVTGGIKGAVKITVGGSGFSGTNTSFEVARFNSSGTLDTSLNTTGTEQIQFGVGHDDAGSALVFLDGNTVLAGTELVNSQNDDFAAVVLNTSDGSLNTNFNGTGFLTADINNRTSGAGDVAIQSDGKYVVAGYANSGDGANVFALARYNPDGSLDWSFGAYGKVTTAIADSANAFTLLIQPDGRIVAAGLADSDTARTVAMARYNTDGTLDASFGANGIVLTAVGGGGAEATRAALQPDGKIVLAGYCYNGANDDFAVVRYLANGALDTSFNGTGKVVTGIATGEDQSRGLAIQPDGKILVTGYGTLGTNLEFAAVRYNTNGVLDNSFGSLGREANGIAGQTAAEGLAMRLQSNNRIVIAGISLNGNELAFAVARYLTNGSLDVSFNGNGEVVTQIGLSGDVGTGVAIQADGKILVAGSSGSGQNPVFAAVRYNVDGSLDGSYGFGGKTVQTFNTAQSESPGAVVLDTNGAAVLVGSAGPLFGIMKLQGDPYLRILTISHLPNGHNLLTGTGVPNGGHTLLSTSSLSAGFSFLGPVPADSTGAWQYEDAALTGVTTRFYRLSYP